MLVRSKGAATRGAIAKEVGRAEGVGQQPGPARKPALQTHTMAFTVVADSGVGMNLGSRLKVRGDSSTLYHMGKMFTKKTELDRHMMVHTADMKPYGCSVCGWEFCIGLNMDKHIQTHDQSGDMEAGGSEESIKTIEVVVPVSALLASPDIFPNIAVLDRHIMVHTVGIQTYGCSVCGCKFHLSLNLDKHIQT